MEALASPHPLIASDLGNRLQGRTVQREAGKVTAQFEDQRLNGGCLQGEVGALEAGIQQPILQTTDEPEEGEMTTAQSGGGARRAPDSLGRQALPHALPLSLPPLYLNTHSVPGTLLYPHPTHPILLINSCSGPSLLTPPPGSLPWLFPAD